MTQDEKWLKNYHAVMEYMETNKRNPSKYVAEERGLVNWCKHQRKVINAGAMPPDRLKKFEALQELMEKYKRVNQW